MTAKGITLTELKIAIEISFAGDREIVKLYDPNVKVESVKDVTDNIFDKIEKIETGCGIKGVFHREKLIGYFVTYDKILVSFSLAMQYRTRTYLRAFFSLIKDEIGKEIYCRLWTKNTRAIRWLMKNGMIDIHQQDKITHLIYLKN